MSRNLAPKSFNACGGLIGRRLRVAGGLVFCRRCGRYSEAKVRGLAANCRPPAGGTSLALRRLARGRHPATGAVLTAAVCAVPDLTRAA